MQQRSRAPRARALIRGLVAVLAACLVMHVGTGPRTGEAARVNPAVLWKVKNLPKATRLHPYAKVNWKAGSAEQQKDAFVKALKENNDGSTIRGDANALERVARFDFPVMEENAVKSASTLLQRNAEHNKELYAKLGLEAPQVAHGSSIGSALRAVASEVARDAPLSTEINAVVTDLVYMTRAIKISKTLRDDLTGSYTSYLNDVDVSSLAPVPRAPREAVSVLNALKKRRMEHESVLGGMFSDANGFYLSLEQARALKPLFDALKLKQAPDSLPAEWRTKIGFAFREVLDKGDDASSLSRAIVRRAKLQGDDTFWGHLPPRGVKSTSISSVDPQEAERLMDEFRRTHDWSRVGNVPVKPYTEAYFH